MRIAFVGGAGIRTVGEYTWQGKGDVVEVEDKELLVTLLLHPGDQFAVSADEPLLRLADVGIHIAGAMALEGVASLEALASLTVRKVNRLAKALGVKRVVVHAWVTQANEYLAEV